MSQKPRQHTVKQGESSYDFLSRQHYGDDLGVQLIKSANPGVPDPPPVGVTVIIPDRPPVVPEPPRPTLGVGPEECELFVDNKRFRFWSTMAIVETLDAVSTVEFTAPQAATDSFLEAFQPLTFPDLHVYIGGELQFTGTMLNTVKKTDANEGPSISVGGYARCGVLGDCTLPASAYPFQPKQVGLRVIAERICAPWSLPVEVDGDMGGTFRRVRLSMGQRALQFLTGLAKQRKVLLSSSVNGGLLMSEPPTVSEPVAVLEEGKPPFQSCRIAVDPQKCYSHLTVARKTARRVSSSAHTVINPNLQGVLRPLNMQSEDTNSASELPTSAEAMAGRMLAGAVSWELQIAGMLTGSGELFRKGDTVLVTAPSVDILTPTELIIRSVRRSKSPTETNSSFELVLPGAFSGVLPARMPWQGDA